MTKILYIFLASFVFSLQSSPMIVEFTAEYDTLPHSQVEQGHASAQFSWHVEGVADDDRMEMHAWVNDEWALIGEGFESSKTDTLVIAHPLSFELPQYRLSVVKADGERIAEKTIELAYTSQEYSPYINFLEPIAGFAHQMTIADFQHGLHIHWYIAGRTQTSKPVFEQLLPNGRVITLSDDETVWVRSWDDGVIYPRYFEGLREVNLRLRLVDVLTGETLASKERVIPIDPISDHNPGFLHLDVSVDGGVATLNWDIAYLERLYIAQYDVNSINCKYGRQPSEVYELPPSGSLTANVPEIILYRPLEFVFISEHFIEAQYGCGPSHRLGRVQIYKEGYSTLLWDAEDTVKLDWSVYAGESVTLHVSYSGQEDQVIVDLPLNGTLTIPTVDAGSDDFTLLSIDFYAVNASGEAQFLWQRTRY